MDYCQVKTVDLWLEENNYSVDDGSYADSFVVATTELKLMKAFCEFPYLTEDQLIKLSEESGLSCNQIKCWFNKKRLQNYISWSPSEIDYAKSIILNYHNKKKQNNRDSLKKVASHNERNISNIPSKKFVASISQIETLHSESSAGDLKNKKEPKAKEVSFQANQQQVLTSRLLAEDDSIEDVTDQRDLTENVVEDDDEDDSEDGLDNDMGTQENVLEDGDKDQSEDSLDNDMGMQENVLEEGDVENDGAETRIRKKRKLKRNPELLKRTDLFACTVCNAIFGTKKALETHMKRKHRQQKRHSCNLCDYSTDHKSKFKSHQLTHTKIKEFVCGQCKKGFGQKGNLNTHIKAVHSKETYKCEICSKSFARKSSLQYHISAVHQKQKPFVCIECGKSFGYSYDLIKHERIHTGVKLFNCKYCSKSFRLSSILKHHEIRMHTRNFPHNCSICKKGFLCPSDLKNHLEFHK